MGNGRPRVVEHIVQPSQADGRLQGVLATVALALNCGEQRRDDAGQAGRRSRGGCLGALGAVCGDLGFGARRQREALDAPLATII